MQTRLAYGADPSQFGELWVPAGAGPHPVLILIHGGFWRARYGLDLMNPLAADLHGNGYAVWNVEYRRLGQEGGGWPGTLLDVAMAADSLRLHAPRFHLDLGRVVVIGHSAGGHLALWLAGRRRLAPTSPLASPDPLPLCGAISLAGVNDLALMHRLWDERFGDNAVAALMGGTPEEKPHRYGCASPRQLLPLGVPQVLVHGTADDRVPIDLSLTYLAAAQAAGDAVSLVEWAGADHFQVIDPAAPVWAPVAAAVAQLTALPAT